MESKRISGRLLSVLSKCSSQPRYYKKADMIILDEVHLANATARSYSRIFDIISNDSKKALLGLTATINEFDARTK